jgi:Tol biopolymer transport system component
MFWVVRLRSLSPVVVLAVVAVGLAGSSASAGATVASVARGKLVLAGDRLSSAGGAARGLYVMNADGSGLRQIVRNSYAEDPHWSPDGRRIAFIDEPDLGEQRIAVVRGDGSGRHTLGIGNSSDSLTSPDPWSPDGRRLAWSGCGGLCVYDFPSSRRISIALAGGETDAGFSWSPDGRKLVAAGENGLVVIDLSHNQRSVLTDHGTSPAYSPNGKEIAFIGDDVSGPNRLSGSLWLIPATGGRARPLDRKADSEQPSWSPDGSRLLYIDTRRQHANGFALGGVRVLTVATGTSRRVASAEWVGHWSPDGTTIGFGVDPTWDVYTSDVWLARADGSQAWQLTSQFPTGVGYSALDWHSGSVPRATSPTPQTVALTPTGQLQPDSEYMGDLSPAATAGSVAYRSDHECDYQAETFSSRLTVWAPSDQSGSTSTTTTPCLDLPVVQYAVTPTLVAWSPETNPVDGSTTISVGRPGTIGDDPLVSWTSGQDSPDIGVRSDIMDLRGDGSRIVFDTDTKAGRQLWRIADGTVPHAVQIPLPPDATDLIGIDGGRILVATGKRGFAVIGLDGAVLARVRGAGTALIGGGLLAVASGTTLSVYDADSGTLRYQHTLVDTTGRPSLLTVGDGYAAYTSGIALHVLRLGDGADQVAALPGQADLPEALLTADGLFVGYFKGYDPTPARLSFVPTANLP